MQDFAPEWFVENKQFSGDSLFGDGCKSCKITLMICRTLWPRFDDCWNYTVIVRSLNFMRERTICFNRL